MVGLFRSFGMVRGNRRGVTAIEYALMAGDIAVALVFAMADLNSGVRLAFHTAANAIPQ